MEVKVDTITRFLKALSWNKLLQVATLVLLFVVSFGFWENRAIIYNSVRVGARVETSNPLVLELSNDTKSHLDSSVLKVKSLVAGVQILNVDFKKNSTSTAYFAFSSEDMKRAYTTFEGSKLADNPLFSGNEIENQKIINLINGEFVCTEFKENTTGLLFPTLTDKIETVCAISIPPYYGRFSGFMNIYLYTHPSTEEVALIRQVSRDISLKIYEVDVDKSNLMSKTN